jgi:hypothetical protein
MTLPTINVHDLRITINNRGSHNDRHVASHLSHLHPSKVHECTPIIYDMPGMHCLKHSLACAS